MLVTVGNSMICSHCNGTGWLARDIDGTRRVERCECWRSEVAREMLSHSLIPSRYEKCDFSTFITYENDRLVRAVNKAQTFAQSFPVVEKGLLFIGPPGIGGFRVAGSSDEGCAWRLLRHAVAS